MLAGILTGANMSGDLRDPQKAIPAGTILAQLTCSFIFLLLVFFYGGTTQGDVLRDKYHQFINVVISVNGLFAQEAQPVGPPPRSLCLYPTEDPCVEVWFQ